MRLCSLLIASPLLWCTACTDNPGRDGSVDTASPVDPADEPLPADCEVVGHGPLTVPNGESTLTVTLSCVNPELAEELTLSFPDGSTASSAIVSDPILDEIQVEILIDYGESAGSVASVTASVDGEPAGEFDQRFHSTPDSLFDGFTIVPEVRLATNRNTLLGIHVDRLSPDDTATFDFDGDDVPDTADASVLVIDNSGQLHVGLHALGDDGDGRLGVDWKPANTTVVLPQPEGDLFQSAVGQVRGAEKWWVRASSTTQLDIRVVPTDGSGVESLTMDLAELGIDVAQDAIQILGVHEASNEKGTRTATVVGLGPDVKTGRSVLWGGVFNDGKPSAHWKHRELTRAVGAFVGKADTLVFAYSDYEGGLFVLDPGTGNLQSEARLSLLDKTAEAMVITATDRDLDQIEEITVIGLQDGELVVEDTVGGGRYSSTTATTTRLSWQSSGQVLDAELATVQRFTDELSVVLAVNRSGTLTYVQRTWRGRGNPDTVSTVDNYVGESVSEAIRPVFSTGGPDAPPMVLMSAPGSNPSSRTAARRIKKQMISTLQTYTRSVQVAVENSVVSVRSAAGEIIGDNLPIDVTAPVSAFVRDGRTVLVGRVITEGTDPDGNPIVQAGAGVVTTGPEGTGVSQFAVDFEIGIFVPEGGESGDDLMVAGGGLKKAEETGTWIRNWQFGLVSFDDLPGPGDNTIIDIQDLSEIGTETTEQPNTLLSPRFIARGMKAEVRRQVDVTEARSLVPTGSLPPSVRADLVAVLPVPTDTGCPYATRYIPGTNPDTAANLALALTLDRSDAADCFDLAVPIGRMDVVGNGRSRVVLAERTSTGAALFDLLWDGESLYPGPGLALHDSGGITFGFAEISRGLIANTGDFNGDGFDGIMITGTRDFVRDGDELVLLVESAGDSLGFTNQDGSGFSDLVIDAGILDPLRDGITAPGTFEAVSSRPGDGPNDPILYVLGNMAGRHIVTGQDASSLDETDFIFGG